MTRAVPARQRLDAGDVPGLQVPDRLEEDLQLIGLDRLAQFLVEDLHLGVVRQVDRAQLATALRFVQRHAGAAAQHVGIGSVVRIQRDAHDWVNLPLRRRSVQRLLERLGQAGAGQQAMVLIEHAGQYHQEAVVAGAENLIDRPQRLHDQRVRLLLGLLTLLVAEVQADFTQAGYAQDEHGELLAGHGTGVDVLFDRGKYAGAVQHDPARLEPGWPAVCSIPIMAGTTRRHPYRSRPRPGCAQCR